MNYKAIIKKQSTIIVIAVIFLTIITIGVSYALFFQVETNSNNQIVTAGTLNVSYGSGSSSIIATDLLPMSDDEALTSTTMTGTIYVENKGTLAADYEIAIGDDTESFNKRENALDTDQLLSHDYIRVAAYLNGTLVVEPTTLSSLSPSTDDVNLNRLFEGTLDVSGTGNSTMTIVIKVWIDENAPESIIGNFVYLKMNVLSEVNEFVADGKTSLKDMIISSYGGENSITTLSDFSSVTADGEGGLYKAGDDYGISYYFRGDVNDNYVKFGKWANTGADMYWRIVRINGNGTIRLVYDGSGSAIANGTEHTATTGSSAFNKNCYQEYCVGYTYDKDGTDTDSTIKGELESWYENYFDSSYDEYVADTIFCNDRSIQSIQYESENLTYTYYNGRDRLDITKKPRLSCPQKEDRYTINENYGNGLLKKPVGLLTADEIAMAGGVHLTQNSNYYLYTGESYWTMTPYQSQPDYYVFSTDSTNSLNGWSYVSDTSLKIRPVINLRADIEFVGTGEIGSPYEIKELAE